MAKVNITITDVEDGKVQVDFKFDPPTARDAEEIPKSALVGWVIIDYVRWLLSMEDSQYADEDLDLD